ncbi:alpha/beta hydrolase [Pararhodobacter sp. SW119]|uniref:alpha/beta fold hydrolase n=1 Tax=Pararhodobacter sp. SW119 TaxID=2780075 RepID=UPI001ADEEFDF
MGVHLHRAGTGPPIVFLHGWTMTGDIFAPAFARLSDRFTCLAPDLPGHGATTGFPATVAGGAEMLGDLLSDLKDATLVGWSLGALIAWSCLDAGRAGPVRAMVSLDMSPRPLPAPDWDLGLRGQTAAEARAKTDWFRSDWPAAASAIAHTMFASADGAPALSVAQAQARIAAQNPGTMADFWASLVEVDLRPAIARLPVPLLAIHGAESRVYPPATAHWLATTAPRGQALVLPGAGHAPHLEAPDQVCAAIARFATRPEAG